MHSFKVLLFKENLKYNKSSFLGVLLQLSTIQEARDRAYIFAVRNDFPFELQARLGTNLAVEERSVHPFALGTVGHAHRYDLVAAEEV